jgi:hypothetical protein
MKTNNEIFLQALKEMPEKFTSLQFSNMCRQKGFNPSVKFKFHQFLHKYCDSAGYHSRCWTKIASREERTLFNTPTPQLTEEKCIEFLKSLGCYRIQKIVTEYKDI